MNKLPSPCGDKLKHYAKENRISRKQLPSPCGDKLKPGMIMYFACNYIRLPSPCGDKLKRRYRCNLDPQRRLPSPCGDKLKHTANTKHISRKQLPSPCGDKLKPQNRAEGAEDFHAQLHRSYDLKATITQSSAK